MTFGPAEPASSPAPQHTQLSNDDRADCAVCADLLAMAPVPGALALVAAALAAWRWMAAPPPWPAPIVAAGLATLLAVLLERYLAVRVALDARLFHRLAQGAPAGLPGLQALDGSLQRVLGRRPAGPQGAHPPRGLAARLAGARRLHRLHLAAVVLVLAGTGATACTAGWAA
jgi:hypothetical protein